MMRSASVNKHGLVFVEGKFRYAAYEITLKRIT